MEDDVYIPTVISKPRDLPEQRSAGPIMPVDPSWSPSAAELSKLHAELDLLEDEDS